MADWGQDLDLNQGGSGAPQVPMGGGQPMSLSPPQANDPNAGAGWRQGVKQMAGAIGNAAAGFHVSNGQVTGGGDASQGQAMQRGPTPPGATGTQADAAARALQLMKQGVISPAQFAQMTGQQLPPGSPDLMPQGRTAPSFNPNGPWGARDVAPPTGPTSPAWGR